MRNKKQTITDGQLRILRYMLAAEERLNAGVGEVESGDDELVWSVPGGWWLGNERVSGKIGKSLVRDCLVSKEDGSEEGYKIFSLNSDGRQIARDPTIEPPIRKLAAVNIGRFAF